MKENFRDHRDSGGLRKAVKELGQEVYNDVKKKPVVNRGLARTASDALKKAESRVEQDAEPTKPTPNRFNPARWEGAAALQTLRDPDKDD